MLALPFLCVFRVKTLQCCLQRRRRSGGYTTTATREQFVTKNPAYTAETGAPSGGAGGSGAVTGLKSEDIVRVPSPVPLSMCILATEAGST